MGWIRLTPAGEEDGHLFTAYNYTDHRHNLNKAYQLDDETPIYILDDVGIALSDAELAAIPPVKVRDERIAELAAACQGLLGFIKTFDMGGDWCQDNYPAIKEAKAALAPFKEAE